MRYFVRKILGAAILLLSLQAHSVFANKNPTNPAEALPSEISITSAIKAQYARDKLLKPYDIQVTTKNNAVVLSGFVDSKKQFEQAVLIAELTPNVIGTDADNLKIKGSDLPLADTYLTAKVKAVLLKDKLTQPKTFKSAKLSVETVDGVVYLTGSVRNKLQLQKIIREISAVDGVKQVKTKLKI